MGKHGEIDLCHQLDKQTSKVMNLKHAVLIRYTHYKAARDLCRVSFVAVRLQAALSRAPVAAANRRASQVYKNNTDYVVDALPVEQKMVPISEEESQNQEFLEHYDRMRRSVYVSSLAPDVTEEDVAKHFGVVEKTGQCVRVRIVRRSGTKKSRFCVAPRLPPPASSQRRGAWMTD